MRLWLGALSIAATGCLASVRSDDRTAYGLPRTALQTDDHLHLGFLPDWSHENPIDIQSALGERISIIGDYINLSPSSTELRQVDYHLGAIREIADPKASDEKPVYAPAILWGADLGEWTDEVTANIAQKVAQVNSYGIPVWLRLLYEMNGYWMSWGMDPERYIDVWRSVTDAVRAETNNTYMLWSPNIWGGSVDNIQGYTPYWPGEEYVDIAGLSFYHRGIDGQYNQPAEPGNFRSLFAPFHELFAPSSSSDYRRRSYSNESNPLGLSVYPSTIPVIISETSAQYYYEIPPDSSYADLPVDSEVPRPLPNVSTLTPSMPPSGFSQAWTDNSTMLSELYIKANWYTQLASNSTTQLFPNYLACSFFNYFKRANGSVLADFRYVDGNTRVESWMRGVIGNETAYEQGYTGAAASHVNPASALASAIFVALLSALLHA